MTLEQLKKIKEEEAFNLSTRAPKHGYKVVVSMGTIGIEKGAREILVSFSDKLCENNLLDVKLLADGYNPECGLEPMVDVVDPDGNKYRYVKVTKNDVDTIVKEHIINGKVVEKLLAK